MYLNKNVFWLEKQISLWNTIHISYSRIMGNLLYFQIKTDLRVGYGCDSCSQISPLWVLFLWILKIFCPSKAPRERGNISGVYDCCPLFFWRQGWYLSVAQGLEEETKGHNPFYFTDVARAVLPRAMWKAKRWESEQWLINSNSEDYLDQKGREITLGKWMHRFQGKE